MENDALTSSLSPLVMVESRETSSRGCALGGGCLVSLVVTPALVPGYRLFCLNQLKPDLILFLNNKKTFVSHEIAKRAFSQAFNVCVFSSSVHSTAIYFFLF